ncbi:MAG: VOC family protein [Balneolaceae bacterium]|nr:VOC family protein [Balneolaceae bacterium]
MHSHQNGIHHITALSGAAQTNATFYVDTLGLRFIGKSVNQDDPSTPHLFYGNAEGTPGSELTFFPWPRAIKGEPSSGEAQVVAFAIPTGSLDFWQERLEEMEIDFEGPDERFGAQVLRFGDPDGMDLELVTDPGVEELPGWASPGVPAKHAIRGFWGATLRLTETEGTARVLGEVLGFEKAETEGAIERWRTDAAVGGNVLLETVEPHQGRNGRGIIHHVAFRTADEKTQKAYRQQVMEMGLNPTQVIDRHFFKSVYFQEPGGVLFEIATDGPGFGAEKTDENLADEWKLPPWYESHREQIESRLPEIRTGQAE